MVTVKSCLEQPEGLYFYLQELPQHVPFFPINTVVGIIPVYLYAMTGTRYNVYYTKVSVEGKWCYALPVWAKDFISDLAYEIRYDLSSTLNVEQILAFLTRYYAPVGQ